ncbi:TIGR03792 family protein [Prochlorococcus sp. MIT 1307]|uniref:TIGR03792 family protein n=1 Tax=Prochlorococcus sp. MIT 1307 TaxID=3096219 RepID=UPI002A757203|nr:TIGR03792 family protein [Prochlorococcus sp. MIT 1307]
MKNYLIKSIPLRFAKGLVLLLGVLILNFINAQEAYSAMSSSSSPSNQIIIEHLRLHVDDQDRQAWLDAERGSWEQWLDKKRGFLGRKLFWDPLREEAIVMITWASYSQWKDIPQGEIDAVQERFEQLAREGTGKERGNPFPLIYEGELLPQ